MTLSPDLIQNALALVPECTRVVVGFSGGLDSTVLLHLAHEWQRTHPAIGLAALHVNHQLQPLADQWQLHCELLCRHWQIPFLNETVKVERDQASLEQAARTARYAAFRQHVGDNDVLLLAHHRDDQVETLLQRLLRGSGPLGLGGMGVVSRQHGMTILRPLLEQDRVQLEDYVRHHDLQWIEDPSNGDPAFERNFLRHQILPPLRSRWPQLNQTVSRSARLCRDAAELLDDLAEIDGAGQCLAGQPLPVSLLDGLRPGRAFNLLRHWLRLQGATPPSASQLQRVLHEMLPAPDDAQPELLWGAVQLRRYRGALHCVPLLMPAESSPLAIAIDQPQIPLAAGQLLIGAGQGSAFSRGKLAAGPLTVRFREGGERIKPAGRPSNSLKHWLQDYRVPPWWRDHWPILYCGEEIAGLPGLLVCEGFEPLADGDTVWLDWKQPVIDSPSR